jgi:hypothetical protein
VASLRTELGRLSAALNQMLTRIEAADAARAATTERMQRFIADAGHELRTPLFGDQGLHRAVPDERRPGCSTGSTAPTTAGVEPVPVSAWRSSIPWWQQIRAGSKWSPRPEPAPPSRVLLPVDVPVDVPVDPSAPGTDAR